MKNDLIQSIKDHPKRSGSWERWYKSAYRAAFFIAFKRTNGDKEKSEELVQEAFFRFIKYRAIEKVNNEKEAISYLVAILKNVHLKTILKKKKLEQVSSTFFDSETTSPEYNSDIFDITRAARNLSKEEQLILLLAIRGESISEIARITDNSYTNAGVKLHRLRSRLKEIVNG